MATVNINGIDYEDFNTAYFKVIFKAKKTENDAWVEGFYNGEALVEYDTQDTHVIVNETLCCCIGLTDANNKLIYENDVVNESGLIYRAQCHHETMSLISEADGEVLADFEIIKTVVNAGVYIGNIIGDTSVYGWYWIKATADGPMVPALFSSDGFSVLNENGDAIARYFVPAFVGYFIHLPWD